MIHAPLAYKEMNPKTNKIMRFSITPLNVSLKHWNYLISTAELVFPPAHSDRRICYIQSPQPNPDWGISSILSQPPSLPLCLLTTDSVHWAHAPLPHPTPSIPVNNTTSFPPAHFNTVILQHPASRDPPAVYLSSCIFQSPAFSWGRSEHTDRNVEL